MLNESETLKATVDEQWGIVHTMKRRLEAGQYHDKTGLFEPISQVMSGIVDLVASVEYLFDSTSALDKAQLRVALRMAHIAAQVALCNAQAAKLARDLSELANVWNPAPADNVCYSDYLKVASRYKFF